MNPFICSYLVYKVIIDLTLLLFIVVDFNNCNLMNFLVLKLKPNINSLIWKLIFDFMLYFFEEVVLEKETKLTKSKWVCFSSANSQKMVGLPGLEPGTSPLSGVHSNQLSYRPFLVLLTLFGVRTFTSVVTYSLYAPPSAKNLPWLKLKSLRKQSFLRYTFDIINVIEHRSLKTKQVRKLNITSHCEIFCCWANQTNDCSLL